MVTENITKKKTNGTIKRELLNLLQANDNVQEQWLNERANIFTNSHEAIIIIYHYQDIIKTQNKKQ